MDYKSIIQNGNDVVVTEVNHFNLAETLDNGQAFRWRVDEEGTFSGIAHGRRLDVELMDGNLTLKNVTLSEFDTIWKDYFDLNRDYSVLRNMFNNCDNMVKALAFSPGLRLMRQDTWEMLISFILSQNSNIPRIKQMIALLCQHFGRPIAGSTTDFAFPTPQALASLCESDLAPIKTGYRAPYIIDAAKRVAGGMLDLNEPSHMPTAEVREALLSVHGVGPKVADCVLLFGFGRLECFPLDVWMKRVMVTLYPSGFPSELSEYAGIAQQFLFHYARVHGL